MRTRWKAAAILGPWVLAATLGTFSAAEVPVRFTEGALHGFLVLRTLDGVQRAQGDVIQVSRDGAVENHTAFLFDDGSTFDETVVFTQRDVFSMKTYRLVQRGLVFPEDTEITLESATGTYRVTKKEHKGGKEKVLEGTLELPPDVYNGMMFTVAKNLADGAGETVHMVAFTPGPRIIQLEIAPANAQTVLVGKLDKTVVDYVFRPRLGTVLKFFAALTARTPPDLHAWFVRGEVPALVRFEGPLYLNGPVWRIEMMNARWPVAGGTTARSTVPTPTGGRPAAVPADRRGNPVRNRPRSP